MGKRSSFERRERDFYPTPYEAALPLKPHLFSDFKFIEPCAGDGSLIKHLNNFGGKCIFSCDIEPQCNDIKKYDAFNLDLNIDYYDFIITNPPWNRKILHPMIEHFISLSHTWLLFDSDWMHTKQSHDYMPYCHKIVSVGRVKWIPESKYTGKDNCAWYLFKNFEAEETIFIGR